MSLWICQTHGITGPQICCEQASLANPSTEEVVKSINQILIIKDIKHDQGVAIAVLDELQAMMEAFPKMEEIHNGSCIEMLRRRIEMGWVPIIHSDANNTSNTSNAITIATEKM